MPSSRISSVSSGGAPSFIAKVASADHLVFSSEVAGRRNSRLVIFSTIAGISGGERASFAEPCVTDTS